MIFIAALHFDPEQGQCQNKIKRKKNVFQPQGCFCKKKTPTSEFLRLNATLKARFNQPLHCSVLLCKPLINWFSLLLTHVTNE